MRQSIAAKPVPHDTEAECAILGAMLKDESLIPDVRRVLRPEHFYTPANHIVCEILFSLADRGEASLTTVKNELAARGQLANVGRGTTEADGIAYLQELADEWSQLAYALRHDIKAVRCAAALRELVSISQRLYHDAKNTPIHDVESVLDRYQQELFKLDLRADAGRDIVTAADAVTEAIEHADKVKAGKAPPGLLTGFGVIDQATGALQTGDLWTLAAATGTGKTAFALAVAANVAERGGAVLYVSAEMNHRAIANRLLQARAGIDSGRLRSGNLNEQEWQERKAAASQIRGWELAIQDSAVTVGEIAIRARQWATRWHRPLDLIVVDYLQLLKPSGGDTRAQQISGIAWGLKNLAMETGTPVMMLSQLNREGVKRKGPPPLYCLKESGDIENHSNAVLLLHRPCPAKFDTDGVLIVWARIAKARDGMITPWPRKDGTGGILLRFKPAITRFEPLTLSYA